MPARPGAAKQAASLGLGLIAFLLLSACAHFETDRQLTKGDYGQAERSLAVRPPAGEIKSDHLVRQCQTLAKLKKYGELEACLDQLEQNILRGDRRISSLGLFNPDVVLFPGDIIAIPPLMRATAALETGDFSRALREAQKSLDAIEQMDFGDKFNNWDRRIKLRALSLLVLANARLGNREAAETQLAAIENTGIGFSAGFWVKKEKDNELAKAYIALQKYDRALEYFGETDVRIVALHLFTFGILKLVEDKAWGFTELPRRFMRSRALLELGQREEAKRNLDRLLQNPATPTNGEIYWAVLYDRGRVAEAEGRQAEAARFYRRAIEVIESQRASIHTEASKIGFVGDKEEVYHRLIKVLFQDRRYADAFWYVERAKSRALVDLLASRQGQALTATVAGGELLRDLSEAERTERVAFAPAGESAKTHAPAGKRSIVLQEKLKQEHPRLASLVTVNVPAPEHIQNLLAEDETLLEYYLHGEDLYLFLLTRKDLTAIKKTTPGLPARVERFRRQLQNPSTRDYRIEAQALYQLLFAPAASLIKTENLTIVPHGILHYLPFQALFDGQNYLLDGYNLRYLPSAGVLPWLPPPRAPAGGPILILGNPDLNDPALDLRFAEEEAGIIAKIMPQARVLLRKEASRETFQREAHRYPYLHIAGHGVFKADAPLESALLLAGSGPQSGRLTIGDIYNLRLTADLVTLSACETALGKINAGDDVVGLTRGFLFAGAGAVVASLWEVDDEVTALLMGNFYSHLARMDKRRALRAAQMKVKETRHPFFWAAFQVTGGTVK
jgi:CHAT domain-containing protein